MESLMKVDLGGQSRDLLFGRLGFYSYIEEQTKADPLLWFQSFAKEGEGFITQINDVAIVVFAGINTAIDNSGGENVPFEKVRKWVNGITLAQMTDIISFAFNSFVVKQGTEVKDEKKNIEA